MKWLALIIGCVLASLWSVYLALKAFNGILYEIGLTRSYLDEAE